MTKTTPVAGGTSTLSSGGGLNGPLGLVLAPNGDVIALNGNDGNAVEISPQGKQVAKSRSWRTVLVIFSRSDRPGGHGLSLVKRSARTRSTSRGIRCDTGHITFTTKKDPRREATLEKWIHSFGIVAASPGSNRRWFALRAIGSGLPSRRVRSILDLYLTGYRTIPTIGWLFLLQLINCIRPRRSRSSSRAAV